MLFYLPDMTLGNGAWASANFDPDLDIQILGFTADQEKKVAAVPLPSQDVIGRWINNFPGSSCQITIYRSDGKLRMTRTFQDGGSVETILVERPSSLGRCFEDIEGSDTGDNFVLTPDGHLQLRDKIKLIDVAHAVK